MSLPRIPYETQRSVLAERAKGRTDRQIETILGLSYGLLSKPYRVDTTEEAKIVDAGRRTDDWQKKNQTYNERWSQAWKAEKAGRTRVQGWRPEGSDLVKAKPPLSKPR